MAIWVDTKNIVCCSDFIGPSLFRNLQRDLWHAGSV